MQPDVQKGNFPPVPQARKEKGVQIVHKTGSFSLKNAYRPLTTPRDGSSASATYIFCVCARYAFLDSGLGPIKTHNQTV